MRRGFIDIAGDSSSTDRGRKIRCGAQRFALQDEGHAEDERAKDVGDKCAKWKADHDGIHLDTEIEAEKAAQGREDQGK